MSQETSGTRGRRFGLAAMVATLLLGIAGGGALTYVVADAGREAAAGEPEAELWQCPMHPSVTSDHPGDCPLCGMKLVKVDRPAAAPAMATSEQQHDVYQCPMHPTIVQDHPGDCPLCGMKLVKVDSPAPEATAAQGEREILFYRSPHDPNETSPEPKKDSMGMDFIPVYADEAQGGAEVDGLATVDIDPQRQQLIGLRTAAVEHGEVGDSWRTVGRLAVDERRVRRINVKVGGFVERLFVDFVGRPVKKGEPLFTLYSPELVSAQNEYLLALETRDALASAGAAGRNGDALVASAKRRLALWDISERAIAALEKGGEPTKTMTIYAPLSGVVTQKLVVEGARLDEGDTPYEITDLGTVWVLADVYENDLGRVQVGMPATLTLKAYPNRRFEGRVIFIDPVLDPATRTAKVRLEFQNPGGELKPGMFGEVVLSEEPRQALRIPSDAVVPTGTSSVVFVALAGGKFQPREVELGARDGDHVEVVKGVTAGERVVTRANFLVDSESRLRASLADMAKK